MLTCQRPSRPAVPVAEVSPICTRTTSPGSDQPQIVSGLPRCKTMLSPKMVLTNGKDFAAAAVVAWPGVGCAHAAISPTNSKAASVAAARIERQIMSAILSLLQNHCNGHL